MKTLSYITIAVDPLSSPHTQIIIFRWTQATRKGGKCQCKTFPWVWETAHLTVNPKYQEERGKSQAGGPEDIVVARPITGGKSRGSCCCVRSHWDLWRKEAEVCIWRAKVRGGCEESGGYGPAAPPHAVIQASFTIFISHQGQIWVSIKA